MAAWWEGAVDAFAGSRGLTDVVLDQIKAELKKLVNQALVDKVAELAGKQMIKGIDTFVAVSVKHLDPTDVNDFAQEALIQMLEQQYDQLFAAIKEYVPLQVAVEVAKKQFGSKSDQANAARAAREAGIAELKQEQRDLLRVIAGLKPVD